MPLFKYFALVGSMLLGMLYVAEAQLGPPKSLGISTNFYGLPAPFKAAKSTPILTVREAPAPDLRDALAQRTIAQHTIAQHTIAQHTIAQHTITQTPIMAQPTETRPRAAERKTKKPRKAAKHNPGRNFAQVPRREFGAVW